MSWLANLRRRGVLRVAFSYALIGWLLLQIGDVVVEPLGAPGWVMRALIVVVVAGFPVALLLAWFFELTPQGIERDTLPEGAARPAVRGPRRYADTVIIGVLLVTVIFLLLRQSDWIKGEAGPPVIGVLPFTELGVESSAGDDAYFGSGLADTLTYKLGLLKQLIVLAPSSTIEFRGQGLNLKSVGAKLGATALLEGTVRRAGGLLRINARLVDITSGQQLWSGSYDRSGTDLFAVQDEIAGAVTEALQVVLSPDDELRLAEHSTANLTAYDAYLRAQPLLAERLGDNMQPAVDHLREATRLDPNYALAWSGLAQALVLAAVYGPPELGWQLTGEEAHTAAARARALDPKLGDAYLAEALVALSDNQQGAATEWPEGYITGMLQRAIELSPNNADVLKLQSQYAASPEEGLASLKRAAEVDPQSGVILVNIAHAYQGLGEYDEARNWLLKATTVENPPLSMVSFSLTLMDLYQTGRLDLAARWAILAQQRVPEEFYSYVARILTLNELGAWSDSAQVLRELPKLPKRGMGWDMTQVILLAYGARVARVQGDLQGAAALAQRFAEEILLPAQLWPDVSHAISPFRAVLDIWALADIQAGRAAEALQRYRQAYPDPNLMGWSNEFADPLRAPVLYAVLHRRTGEEAEADRLLRKFLEQTGTVPIMGDEGLGFTRFTAHAFLGETDAAIAALEEALRIGESMEVRLAPVGTEPNTTSVFGESVGLEIISILARARAENGEALGASLDIEGRQTRSLRGEIGDAATRRLSTNDLIAWSNA
ncbi:MAG: hypothetical protein ACREO9_00030, partial [Lysobacterales bacterium]